MPWVWTLSPTAKANANRYRSHVSPSIARPKKAPKRRIGCTINPAFAWAGYGRIGAGGGVGPEYLWLRQVTVLRDDGRQTVIVTNRSNLSAVQVVVAMFRRWRQENYFKYMDAEFALDALVEY